MIEKLPEEYVGYDAMDKLKDKINEIIGIVNRLDTIQTSLLNDCGLQEIRPHLDRLESSVEMGQHYDLGLKKRIDLLEQQMKEHKHNWVKEDKTGRMILKYLDFDKDYPVETSTPITDATWETYKKLSTEEQNKIDDDISKLRNDYNELNKHNCVGNTSTVSKTESVEKLCSTCKYEKWEEDEYPCLNCGESNWQPKDQFRVEKS